ncbi:MAG: hypothetical protein IMX02_06885 [Limnochordaceae bacterium]|nr:hypothetical protein [Limnochordaceae bacterium]
MALLARVDRMMAESASAERAAGRLRRLELRRTLAARIQRHLRQLAVDLEEAQDALGMDETWREAEAGAYARAGAGTYARGKAGRVSHEEGRLAAGGPGLSHDGARPSDEALLARWDLHLQQQGLGERVRTRKLQHIETLRTYLVSGQDLPPAGLLDATGGYLAAFFFWTYVRRYPSSPSDAETFTLDVRDFYRWLAQEGLVTDDRWAELPYRLRHHVGERIRLYTAIDPDDPEADELTEMLFLSGAL